MRAKGHRERSVTMADPLEETISLSDMTEITETEDPRATQQAYRYTAELLPFFIGFSIL